MTWALIVFIVIVVLDVLGLGLDVYLIATGGTDISMIARANPWFAAIIIALQVLAGLALQIHLFGKK